MELIEVANWACNSEAGGSSDVELQPGTYRLDAADIKVVTGPEDADFYLDRPELSVAPLTLTPRSVSGPDGYPDPAIDETLGEPLAPAGFTVAEPCLYRMAWSQKGAILLTKVG